MKGLRALALTAAAVTAVALVLLYLLPVTPTGPGGATGRLLYGVPIKSTLTAIFLLLPIPFLGLAITAVVRASLPWGLAAAGAAVALAAGAPAFELTLGALFFPLGLIVFIESVSAMQRFRAFERDARAAGAQVPLGEKEAAREYLRFAWWPLTLLILVAGAAILAHRALPLLTKEGLVTAAAKYGQSAEAVSPYGLVLVGLGVLALFALGVALRSALRPSK